MGGRIDDTSKLLKTKMKKPDEETIEDLGIMTKLAWSKNVLDERDGMFSVHRMFIIACFLGCVVFLLKSF